MEDPTSFFPTTSPFNTTPLFTTASSAALSAVAPSVAASSATATSDAAIDAAVENIDISPAGSDFLEEVKVFDYSTEDSVESEGELVGDDKEEKYGRVIHEGRLGDDESYFASSDEDSFVLDEDDCCGDDEHEVVDFGRARTVKLSKKGQKNKKSFMTQPQRKLFGSWARFRCKDGFSWLLYASLDKTTNDFMIKTYIPKHTCNKTTRNYLCNAKFLAETFRERIVEQPNKRVFKLQELIRKKFKLYVSKTTVRRARSKVLKEIMGDHVVEFGKILDYKDELLRTNPGTSWVVKLGEANEAGKPKFQTFYICFDALKKAWVHCRKCIGLDGFFLKGISKGQLLVVVAKDGNNQMFPLAWAVVEKKNTNTWIWFVRCIRDDLRLGEGEGLPLVTDMQKGLFATIEEVLPQSEHRRCA
ncbi:uncharacterized protein LOC124888952 [Capsicum annuum]|uniref:uncharacterized protein LOC124888952 n=1 Tax=Capsicum annuum TaxID=4072 RepID=UPI001FB0A906|nr:uncharacterized protein LOC124888952 [Capsicum annuum]